MHVDCNLSESVTRDPQNLNLQPMSFLRENKIRNDLCFSSGWDDLNYTEVNFINNFSQCRMNSRSDVKVLIYENAYSNYVVFIGAYP